VLNPSEKILLKNFAEETKRLIVQAIKSKKITKHGSVNSSGRLAASVEIRYTDTGFQILANDYIIGLIHGVKPGESTATVADLSRWIEEKPIKASIPTGSLAALMLRKQKKEGNMVWRTHKGANSGLLSEPLDDKRFTSFVDLMASQAVETLSDQIGEAFQFQAA